MTRPVPLPEVTPADGWLGPLLSGPACFDSTVPMHMVIAGVSGVLETTFHRRAVWPPAVRFDPHRAAGRVKGLRDLATGDSAAVIDLEDDEEVEVEDLRATTMTRAEIRAKPTKNRGEAECVVISRRLGLPLVVHDEAGRDWGRKEGVRLFTLADCLCAAVRLGYLKPGGAWRAYERVCDGVMIPLPVFAPTEHGRKAFMARVEPLYSLHITGVAIIG